MADTLGALYYLEENPDAMNIVETFASARLLGAVEGEGHGGRVYDYDCYQGLQAVLALPPEQRTQILDRFEALIEDGNYSADEIQTFLRENLHVRDQDSTFSQAVGNLRVTWGQEFFGANPETLNHAYVGYLDNISAGADEGLVIFEAGSDGERMMREIAEASAYLRSSDSVTPSIDVSAYFSVPFEEQTVVPNPNHLIP